MQLKIQNGWARLLLTLLLGLAAFVFWRLLKPAMLIYHEQFQLFQMDCDYFLLRLAEPGGMARYVAEFLVQMFNNLTLGAVVIAVLWMMLQRLTWCLVRAVDRSWGAYLLTFVPVLLLWFYVGDVNVMMTFTVALMLALLTMALCPVATVWRWVYMVFAIPLLYWVAGPVALMLAVYAGWREYRLTRAPLNSVAVGLAAVLLAVACVVVSSWLVAYPLYRLFVGLDYYRYIEQLPVMEYVIMLACAVLPAVAGGLARVWAKPSGRWWLAAEAAVLLAGGCLLVPRGYDAQVYDLLEYDRLVRLQDWNAVIAKAEKKQPNLPMSVCATNLALAMRGELGDRAFDFYQNGTEGLLPSFDRNFFPLLLSAEVYWQLGLVNTAQRFMFEAMEAIPNGHKSERVIKRLAETNLVNGQYQVAAKYLDLLKKTMFYRLWAERTEHLLGNEKAINEHPVYGRLRRFRLQDDFLYSEQEADKVMGRLLMRNKDNMLAMQYLLVYPLLERDLGKFVNYATYVEQLRDYRPKAAQEAAVLAYAQQNQQPPRGSVAPMVAQQFMQFTQAYQQGGAESALLAPFKHTFWYYALCAK